MSQYQDFEYRGYKVKYHSSKGMMCVIWYEVLGPNGEAVGSANSAEDARQLIDKQIDKN